MLLCVEGLGREDLLENITHCGSGGVGQDRRGEGSRGGVAVDRETIDFVSGGSPLLLSVNGKGNKPVKQAVHRVAILLHLSNKRAQGEKQPPPTNNTSQHKAHFTCY